MRPVPNLAQCWGKDCVIVASDADVDDVKDNDSLSELGALSDGKERFGQMRIGLYIAGVGFVLLQVCICRA